MSAALPIPREEPVDPQVARALALATLVSHQEERARELRARAEREQSARRAEGLIGMAEAFELSALGHRATLRALVRSEVIR